MKSTNELKEIAKSLDGLTFLEWQKLCTIIDECFEQKKREFKRTLELHADDEHLDEAIRSRFGGRLG